MTRFLLGVIVLLVLTSGWFFYRTSVESAQNDVLSLQLREATLANEVNVRTIDRLAGAIETNSAISREVADMRAALRSRVNTIMERLDNAPPEDDAPIAPVLRDALIASRELFITQATTGSSNGGDTAPGEPTGPLSRP